TLKVPHSVRLVLDPGTVPQGKGAGRIPGCGADVFERHAVKYSGRGTAYGKPSCRPHPAGANEVASSPSEEPADNEVASPAGAPACQSAVGCRSEYRPVFNRQRARIAEYAGGSEASATPQR